MTITVHSPSDCRPTHIEGFIALVSEGGAVAEADACYGANHASHLAFVHDDSGTLAAVGALKRPRTSYRDRVFREAGAALPAAQFDVELGYVAVANAFRQRGLSHCIVRALLPYAANSDIFATTRADKPAMHRTLGDAGFVREGQLYPNKNGTHDIVLYVRHISSKKS